MIKEKEYDDIAMIPMQMAVNDDEVKEDAKGL